MTKETDDPIVIVISREEVEAGDTSEVIESLKLCIASSERAFGFFERLDIAFQGYDHDRRELFEIDAVRAFVAELDSKFPYWLFFLTKRGLGLQAIYLCFMPPFLTAEGRKKIFPARLQKLLSERWFPAMNQICEAVGFSETRIESLTNDACHYFINGPRAD